MNASMAVDMDRVGWRSRMRASQPHWVEFAKLTCIYNACFTSIVLAPVLLSSYANRLHVAATAVSPAISLENFSYAVGLLLLTNVMARLPSRFVLAGSLAVMATVSVLTIRVDSIGGLLALRACFGLAVGVCTSVVVRRFSRFNNAQHTWSLVGFVNLLYTFVLLLASGPARGRWGLAGVAGPMALIFLLCIGCALVLKPWSEASPGDASKGPLGGGFRLPPIPVLCGALALFLVNAGHTTLWVFQERLGERTDLARSTIRSLLALSIWGAIIGSAAILLIGTRFGRRVPNLVAYLTLIGAAYLLTVPSAVPYIAGATLAKFGWLFGVPILTGALTILDRSGRAGTIGVAMMTLGAAFGPAVASIVAPAGLSLVGWLCCGLYVISFSATVPLLRAAHGRAAGDAAPAVLVYP